MDADTAEFFDLVGAHKIVCEQMLELTIQNKKTGEILVEDLALRCGVLHTDDTTCPQCVLCSRHVQRCDCGAGIAYELTDPQVPLCSPEECQKYG